MAGTAGEGLDAQTGGPGSDFGGTERRDDRRDTIARLTETAHEPVLGLSMGKIETAFTGHQQFSADRGHGVENMHLRSALGQNLCGHQPGGAAADDRDGVQRSVSTAKAPAPAMTQ